MFRSSLASLSLSVWVIASCSSGTVTYDRELTAGPDLVQTQEDLPVETAVAALLANDTANDAAPVALAAVGPASLAGGTVVLENDRVTYSPPADFHGTDTFFYTLAADGADSVEGEVAVEVAPVNDDPLPADDLVTAREDTATTLDAAALVANDLDLDGDTLIVSDVDATSAEGGTVALSAAAPDGTVTYTPARDFFGLDSFSYTLGDAQGGANVATVNVYVAPLNDSPAGAADAVAADEDAVVTLSAAALVANDADIDGDPLTLTAVDAASAGSGQVVLSAGLVIYTPPANGSGQDTFSYTVSDPDGATSTAVVTVTLTPVNDGPVAAGDSVAGAEDTPLAIAEATLLANDTDVDLDTPAVTGVAATSARGAAVTRAGATITYTPPPELFGADTFEYTISDGVLSATATVTVTVAPQDDVPAADDENATVDEDGVVVIDVLAGDTGLGDGLGAVVIATPPASGSAVVQADHQIRYTPSADFNGSDAFTYTVSDADSPPDTDVGAVNITVSEVNDVPLAANDAASTTEDAFVDVDVLANDTGFGDEGLSAATVTIDLAPRRGSALVQSDLQTVRYTPAADFNGTDSFSYHATDGNGDDSSGVLVTVTVAAQDDVPAADDENAIVDEDGVVVIDVLAGDTGLGDGLGAVVIATPPASGSAVVQADHQIRYTPSADFNGSDAFTY
ncbi:MAG: tandem-95 repeat protein, partial [Deltaproteobacteria bacterium]|nr:tandem-95 repeat protein [Deltaproteobacteria bacterium]